MVLSPVLQWLKTDNWIEKTWYTHPVEYYSAVREDEIPPSITTRMDLENIMPSEIRQTEKVKKSIISLTYGI